MNWCFAIVNNRLAEVYFEKFRGRTRFLCHAYVDRGNFKSKKSQMYIKYDTKKFQFTFRSGKYKSKLDDKVFLLEKW